MFIFLTPLSVVWNWPPVVSAVLLFAVIFLLLITGQTIIFLLRLVAADRRTRRRPLGSATKTVGELEDEAEPANATGRPTPAPTLTISSNTRPGSSRRAAAAPRRAGRSAVGSPERDPTDPSAATARTGARRAAQDPGGGFVTRMLATPETGQRHGLHTPRPDRASCDNAPMPVLATYFSVRRGRDPFFKFFMRTIFPRQVKDYEEKFGIRFIGWYNVAHGWDFDNVILLDLPDYATLDKLEADEATRALGHRAGEWIFERHHSMFLRERMGTDLEYHP